MINKKELALEMFKKTNCAQATLVALAREKMDPKSLQLIGSAFGGGVAQQGKTCGAVNGALMALGILKGYNEFVDLEVKNKFYAVANEFITLFKEKYGSDQCKELINYDISDKEQKVKAKNEGIFDNLCPTFVSGAVEIMEELINSKV